jgi:hypothetical protein
MIELKGEINMKLTPPTKTVFWIAVILGIVALLGLFAIPAISAYAFWILFVGFVLLVLGNVMKGW